MSLKSCKSHTNLPRESLVAQIMEYLQCFSEMYNRLLAIMPSQVYIGYTFEFFTHF